MIVFESFDGVFMRKVEYGDWLYLEVDKLLKRLNLMKDLEVNKMEIDGS